MDVKVWVEKDFDHFLIQRAPWANCMCVRTHIIGGKQGYHYFSVVFRSQRWPNTWIFLRRLVWIQTFTRHCISVCCCGRDGCCRISSIPKTTRQFKETILLVLKTLVCQLCSNYPSHSKICKSLKILDCTTYINVSMTINCWSPSPSAIMFIITLLRAAVTEQVNVYIQIM